MAEYRVTVHIDRKPDEVFAAIVDPTIQTVWQSGLQEFDADWQDEPKVGDRARGVVKIAGKRIRWEAETTEVRVPSRIAFRSVEAPFAYEMTYVLAERDGATEIALEGRSGSLGGFFGKLADPVVARMYARDMDSNLRNLKALLEES